MEFIPLRKILQKIQKKNIAIIGHMGSGKSIFGNKIASIFNVEHIDTDNEISISEQSTINDIFAFC